MYYVTHSYSDCGRAYFETDLIEADGEAEELFKDQCFQDGYASQIVLAIDEVSCEHIELDMHDYMGEKKFKIFEKLLESYTEDDGELSHIKVDSWFKAVMEARR